MGVKELRETFNAAADGQFTCMQATLGYEQANDTEWQRLTFSGIAADGTPFSTQSDRLRPRTDVLQAARETAAAFVAKEKPAP
jgi:hypothetical protein